MTEQGAVPDNGIAVEPREAQRLLSLGARTPQAAAPGHRESAVGAQAGLARSVGGLASPWRRRTSGLPDLRNPCADLG